MKVAFLTTTMFSRINGPAIFAVNLFKSSVKDEKLKEIEIDFITEDAVSKSNIILVSNTFSSFFKRIGMLVKAIEYSKTLDNKKYNIAVWNFSVLGWYSIFKKNKKIKNVVFVNDPYSLNLPSKINYKYFRLKLFRFFESYSCKNSDHIITNSEVIKSELQKAYKIDLENISVLHKGIDCEIEAQLKSNWNISKTCSIRIAFVKSNYIDGGLELLYNSLLLLPDFNFEIVVIGPQQIGVHCVNVSNIKMNLLGRVTDKLTLYNVITDCDIFCVPNKQEAFGQANCEAMLLQIPTIILPTNYQLALHDDSYCWIPKSIDEIGLANTIKEIIQTKGCDVEEKVKNARNIIITKYNFRVAKTNFYSILNKVANEGF